MNPTRLILRALGRRLPVTDGSIEVQGATSRTRRDRFGVSPIGAASTGDAWFGLGFCQSGRSYRIMPISFPRGSEATD